MSEQQYDYSRDPTQDAGQWAEPTGPPPPGMFQRAHRFQLHRPFRTGVFLGFGFMFAALVLGVVMVAIMVVLGVGPAGIVERFT